jgi:hypothetical protein
MRRLTRTLVVAGAALAALLGGGPARAEWNPTDPGTGGVSVTVYQPAGPGASSQAGGSSAVRCTYTKDTGPVVAGDPHADEQGTYYTASCVTGPLSGFVVFNLWVPAGQPAVAPGILAQVARRYLPLPPPAIHTNPPATTDQLVNLASWLWADPATWGQRRATASVPNESATVVATPVSVTWTMGDGGKVTCRGPGTPYDPARPPDGQRTDCAYTYRRSSAGQPGERYAVSATTTWALRWTATGAVTTSGTLPPLLRTSTTTLRVAEAQAIN